MQDIYVNIQLSKLHVHIIILHIDIVILHVNINKLHVDINKLLLIFILHGDIIILHVDINKLLLIFILHGDIIILHVDIFIFHVDIRILHVDIIFRKKIKVCLWNTVYAPGGNQVQKAIYSFKVKVKVTRSLTLVSIERASLVEYACQIWSLYLLGFKS